MLVLGNSFLLRASVVGKPDSLASVAFSHEPNLIAAQPLRATLRAPSEKAGQHPARTRPSGRTGVPPLDKAFYRSKKGRGRGHGFGRRIVVWSWHLIKSLKGTDLGSTSSAPAYVARACSAGSSPLVNANTGTPGLARRGSSISSASSPSGKEIDDRNIEPLSFLSEGTGRASQNRAGPPPKARLEVQHFAKTLAKKTVILDYKTRLVCRLGSVPSSFCTDAMFIPV